MAAPAAEANGINPQRDGDEIMSPNRICIILLAVLILAVPVCGAKPENIVMGPYRTSFDMGDIGLYTINLKPPSESENFQGTSYACYKAMINGTFPLKVIIEIQDFSTPMGNNAEETIRDAFNLLSYTCGEPMIINRTIDSKPAVLGSASCLAYGINLFCYPLNYYPKDNTATSVVIVVSNYPWDGGTSALVKTIHVEKA